MTAFATRPSALGMSDPVMEFLEILEPKNHYQNFEGVGRDEVGKVIVMVVGVVVIVIMVVIVVVKEVTRKCPCPCHI